MDERMLTAAMRKAVELGVFPETVSQETGLRNWAKMEQILVAALSVQQINTAECPSDAAYEEARQRHVKQRERVEKKLGIR